MDTLPTDRARSRVGERLGRVRTYAEGAIAREPKIAKFVIITSGRSGSELLVTLLNSHPGIKCDGELLLTRRLSAERFINGRAAVAQRSGQRAYGLKLLPPHIIDVQRIDQSTDWLRHLADDGWTVIRLGRRNRLHQSISMVRANHTQWHVRAGDESPFEPIHIDVMQLIATMYVTDWIENQIDHLLKGVDYQEYWYEDDLENPENQSATVAAICRSLGLEPAPTSTDLVRVHPGHVREMITNYDEVVVELRRNRYEQYADE
jgi:LPS sulfotransferase NodH